MILDEPTPIVGVEKAGPATRKRPGPMDRIYDGDSAMRNCIPPTPELSRMVREIAEHLAALDPADQAALRARVEKRSARKDGPAGLAPTHCGKQGSLRNSSSPYRGFLSIAWPPLQPSSATMRTS